VRCFPDKYVHRTPARHGKDGRIVGDLAHQHLALAVVLLGADRHIIACLMCRPALLELGFCHATRRPPGAAQALVSRHVARLEAGRPTAVGGRAVPQVRQRVAVELLRLLQAQGMSSVVDAAGRALKHVGDHERRQERVVDPQRFVFVEGPTLPLATRRDEHVCTRLVISGGVRSFHRSLGGSGKLKDAVPSAIGHLATARRLRCEDGEPLADAVGDLLRVANRAAGHASGQHCFDIHRHPFASGRGGAGRRVR